MIKKIISKVFSKKSSPAAKVGGISDHNRKKEIEKFRQSVHKKLKHVPDGQDKPLSSRQPSKSPSKPNRDKPNRDRNRDSEKPKDYREAKDRGTKEPQETTGKGNRYQDRKKRRPYSGQGGHNQRPKQHAPSQSPSLNKAEKMDEVDKSKVVSPPKPFKTSAETSVFNSDKKFSELGISSELSDCLTQHKFIHPSKAQDHAIPVILEKKNLICSSETGSGKTLAFVIPILERFMRKEIDQACILTPTREIAIQIESVTKPLTETLGITTGLAIGGLDMLVQKKILRDYPQILIATPGRLVDVSSQGLVWLNYTNVVVLDEVDRMLDMGFEKEISTLFGLFPSQAQILMFTATMNKELEKLSQNYVKDYDLIKIGDTMKTKASIEHVFISLPSSDRYRTLKALLQRKSEEKVLVFFNSIDETIKVFRDLKRDHLPKLNCLHSRKSQDERNLVMTAFRDDRINHLLTTDVLARGIDIPNIDTVINYELPRDGEDYIHRIGRTGRADDLGKALSFVNKKDEIKLKKIKNLIKSDQGFNFIGLNELKYF